MSTGPTLACYLLREDGEWYELGDVHRWRVSFAVFPGPADGSVELVLEDVPVLALRLDDYGHDPEALGRLAMDIVRWGNGKRMRFVSELEPEVEPGILPSPITGTARAFLECLDKR